MTIWRVLLSYIDIIIKKKHNVCICDILYTKLIASYHILVNFTILIIGNDRWHLCPSTTNTMTQRINQPPPPTKKEKKHPNKHQKANLSPSLGQLHDFPMA